ncbi:MAG: inositol monophosphatase family protein [Pseudomonadales bacterium]
MLVMGDKFAVSEPERAAFLAFACEVAVEAGSRTLQWFRTAMHVENKLDGEKFDPVTAADRAAEAVVRERVQQRFPTHGVLGEEFGATAGCGLTWVIDPIDGTRAFMSGMVHWGLLLALFDGEEPIVGVMYQPFTQELWYGDGRSAFYRRGEVVQPLRTRQIQNLGDAVLGVTNPKLIPDEIHRRRYEDLEKSVRLARYGGDCYLYGVLAMGFLDIGVDGGLQPYDIQALIPIICGAGGLVTNWDGGSAAFGGNILASGCVAIHEAALRLLQA